jgi:hypothetical protein
VNDFGFVKRVQRVLGSFGVETWIFGGWAKEIRGLIRPREHADRVDAA